MARLIKPCSMKEPLKPQMTSPSRFPPPLIGVVGNFGKSGPPRKFPKRRQVGKNGKKKRASRPSTDAHRSGLAVICLLTVERCRTLHRNHFSQTDRAVHGTQNERL